MKALVIAMFLLAVAGGLQALELYLRRAVVLQGPRPAVRDLVHILPGDAGAQDLDVRLGFDVSRPTLLPASAVRQALAGRDPSGERSERSERSEPVIVTGGRVALVPASMAGARESLFYRDLLEFLDSADRDRSGRLEIEAVDPPLVDDYDGGLRRYFELREQGDLTEVSYPTLSGRPRSFRVRLLRPGDDAVGVASAAAAPPAAASARDARPAAQRELALRSGERIRIRFVRDSVTVTLPGRALRSGYQGDVVAVRALDNERSYDARVTGKREVLVELK